MFSAAGNKDGLKCPNCKTGRLEAEEIIMINDFMAALDQDLKDFEIELGLEPGTLTDDEPDPGCADPEFMQKHPEMFKARWKPDLNSPEGVFSGLKGMGMKLWDDFNKRHGIPTPAPPCITRKAGDSCYVCLFWKPGALVEGKVFYGEGNCRQHPEERAQAFHWCPSFIRIKDFERRK
jgi:hypothetical protein